MGLDQMESGETALYLFCFARCDAVRGLQGTAVDGHRPVLTVRHSPDLWAVVCEVARLSAAYDAPPRPGVGWSVGGRWQVGPLRGAWAKPAAEYVGAGAREQARRRRLASLAGEIKGGGDGLAAARGGVGEGEGVDL